MEFIGGIEGYNYQPISNYNSFLKGNASFNIDMDTKSEFDKILDGQMESRGRKNGDSASGTLMSSISNAFGNGLNSVNDAKEYANKMQEALARGEDVSVHDVMIASEKASLSMQMAMQLRNKLVSAYTDIKNMNF